MLEAATAAGNAPATCMKARRPVFIVALPAKATATKIFAAQQLGILNYFAIINVY
jgi:hypothetical protein